MSAKASARAAYPRRSGVDGHAEPVSGLSYGSGLCQPNDRWPCIYCLKTSTPVMNMLVSTRSWQQWAQGSRLERMAVRRHGVRGLLLLCHNAV